MGTRHLIAVVIDGDFKVAQYGQWDGYPGGQGLDVLKFLVEHHDDMDAFKAKVRQCSWLTAKEGAKIDKVSDWAKKYPHLSRDAGANILEMIFNSKAGLKLTDSRKFAGDSLFCEWAYVIDFDGGNLEVYKGFSQEKTPADSRFPSGAEWLKQERDNEYEPVALVKKYPLATLPVELIDVQHFFDDLAEEDKAA